MARRVLNEVKDAGQGPILNMGMQRLSRVQTTSSNDAWYTDAGRRCYIQRDKTDSRIIYHGAWQGYSANSYQSGMGCRFHNSGNNAVATRNYGWGYIWQHNAGSDMGGGTNLFKAMGSIENLGNETGQCSVRIGWNSLSGGNNRPASYWCGNSADDNRAKGTHYGYWNVMEIDNSKCSYQTNSYSGGL